VGVVRGSGSRVSERCARARRRRDRLRRSALGDVVTAARFVLAERAELRACVVGSRDGGAVYERLGECELAITAMLPQISHVTPSLIAEHDVLLFSCDAKMLMTPANQERIEAIAAVIPMVAVASLPWEPVAAQAARLGVSGLVARTVEPAALMRTIRAACRGEMAFPRAAFALPLRDATIPSPASVAQPDGRLTPRQSQIVRLIAQGATDREIADILSISQSTAHKHVQNALRRVRAKTRSQLVATAQHGFALDPAMAGLERIR
jgi:DNA-binding NarL/FixJ family response regulator